jgi:hypothetical protein
MARIVSELIYKLTADDKELQNSLKKIEKDFDSIGKSFTDAGKKLSLFVTGPIIAAGAGILKLAGDAGKLADRLLDLEQITGLSTDTLQEFKNVANVAGVDFESLVGVLTRFTGRLPTLESESAESAQAIQRLGVNLRDVNGNLRSADELFPEFIGALGDIENITERNSTAQQIFGRSLEALAPVLALTQEQLQGAREEARELGLVQSRESLEAANNYRIAMGRLNQEIEAQKFQLGVQLAPVIESFLPLVRELVGNVLDGVRAFSELDVNTQRTIIQILGFSAALGPTLIVVGRTIQAIGQIKLAFQALSLAGGGPVALAIAGIVALTAGIVALAARGRELQEQRLAEQFGELAERIGTSATEASDFANALRELEIAYNQVDIFNSEMQRDLLRTFTSQAASLGTTADNLVRIALESNNITPQYRAQLETILRSVAASDGWLTSTNERAAAEQRGREQLEAQRAAVEAAAAAEAERLRLAAESRRIAAEAEAEAAAAAERARQQRLDDIKSEKESTAAITEKLNVIRQTIEAREEQQRLVAEAEAESERLANERIENERARNNEFVNIVRGGIELALSAETGLTLANLDQLLQRADADRALVEERRVNAEQASKDFEQYSLIELSVARANRDVNEAEERIAQQAKAQRIQDLIQAQIAANRARYFDELTLQEDLASLDAEVRQRQAQLDAQSESIRQAEAERRIALERTINERIWQDYKRTQQLRRDEARATFGFVSDLQWREIEEEQARNRQYAIDYNKRLQDQEKAIQDFVGRVSNLVSNVFSTISSVINSNAEAAIRVSQDTYRTALNEIKNTFEASIVEATTRRDGLLAQLIQTELELTEELTAIREGTAQRNQEREDERLAALQESLQVATDETKRAELEQEQATLEAIDNKTLAERVRLERVLELLDQELTATQTFNLQRQIEDIEYRRQTQEAENELTQQLRDISGERETVNNEFNEATQSASDARRAQEIAAEEEAARREYQIKLAAWEANRALDILEVIQSTAVGAQRAFSSLAAIPVVGVPLGIAAAITAGIDGLLRVGQIRSLQPPPPPRFAQGGSFRVPDGFENDSFPLAFAQSGERVTVETPAQASANDMGATIQLHVGTLVADPAGLRELDRQLRRYGATNNLIRGNA